MPQLSNMEVLYVAIVVAFFVNYYLIRSGHILPYLENEDDNFLAKLTGFSGFASVVFLIYSFQHLDIGSAIFFFFFSWIVSSLMELLYGDKFTRKEIIFCFLILVGCFIYLRPQFIDPSYAAL